jgi:hypothetical protein
MSGKPIPFWRRKAQWAKARKAKEDKAMARNPNMVGARFFDRARRVRALKLAIAKREVRLERSLAHWRETGRAERPQDADHWAGMRAELATLRETLVRVEAGEQPPISPATGSRTDVLPDRLDNQIGQKEKKPSAKGGARA